MIIQNKFILALHVFLMKQGTVFHRFLKYLGILFLLVVTLILFDFFSLNITGNSIFGEYSISEQSLSQTFFYIFVFFGLIVVMIELGRWKREKESDIDIHNLVEAYRDEFYTPKHQT